MQKQGEEHGGLEKIHGGIWLRAGEMGIVRRVRRSPSGECWSMFMGIWEGPSSTVSTTIVAGTGKVHMALICSIESQSVI